MLLFVSIDNNVMQYIDVGVVINDYHYHLRGEGGGVFIKELHDSHVGRACNDCNGSTICIYHEQKTSAWHVNVLRIHILHVMKGSHASTMAQL